MMKKKILLTYILILSMSLNCAAQRTERRIYLWDVTLSMQGYNGSPNIYDDVLQYMIKDINSLMNANTEIIVCPFQENILDYWKEYATKEGKEKLIKEKLNKAKTKFVNITNTNILGPLMDIEYRYLNNNNVNTTIILLTDGIQNYNNTCNNDILKYLSTFYTKKDFAYLRYVCLTNTAKFSGLEDIVEDSPNMDMVSEWENLVLAELRPNTNITYNIKDKSDLEIHFFLNKDIELPQNLKIGVVLEDNEYLNIDTIVNLIDNKINIPLKYDYDFLKLKLPEKYTIKLNFELEKSNFECEKYKMNLAILPKNSNLILINKPEKVLKIRLKK